MRHHHSPGIRGQLMWFLCCICLFLLALVWFLSTQLLEPLYTKHIEKQLTTQAESITAELDKAIANGEALSAWSFGHLTVNTTFFDRLATQLYASELQQCDQQRRITDALIIELDRGSGTVSPGVDG